MCKFVRCIARRTVFFSAMRARVLRDLRRRASFLINISTSIISSWFLSESPLHRYSAHPCLCMAQVRGSHEFQQQLVRHVAYRHPSTQFQFALEFLPSHLQASCRKPGENNQASNSKCHQQLVHDNPPRPKSAYAQNLCSHPAPYLPARRESCQTSHRLAWSRSVLYTTGCRPRALRSHHPTKFA